MGYKPTVFRHFLRRETTHVYSVGVLTIVSTHFAIAAIGSICKGRFAPHFGRPFRARAARRS